jgi:hypothetical protein
LFIAGWGRSGSTLLGNILGQLPGFFHVGELAHVWRRAIVEDAMCGCGLAFSACPVWSRILEETFGTGAQTAARRMIELSTNVMPTHRDIYLNSLTPRAVKLHGRPGQAEFLEMLGRLYSAVAKNGPSRVIVDTSKTPFYLHALGQVPGLDVRVVHLVRDPRGTSYSWLRRIDRTDARGKLPMEQFSVWESASRWVTWNAIVPIVAKHIGVPVTRITYESFVKSPRATLEKVLSLVTDVCPAPVSALPFVGPNEVELRQTHTVWGNPSRQRTGRVKIDSDSEWLTALSTWDKATVTALTYPLARQYGYFSSLRSRSHRGA